MVSEATYEAITSGICNIGNEISFSLRKNLYRYLFSRIPRQYYETAEDKTCQLSNKALFSGLSAWQQQQYTLNDTLQERQHHFIDQYPLSSLYERSTCLRWLENLTILDALAFFGQAQPFLYNSKNTFSWLDIGCKNWAYVDAIWAFLTAHLAAENIAITLEGIELDPYRSYIDGFHRIDYAEHYISQLPPLSHSKAFYYPEDVMNWQGVGNIPNTRYNVISWFLPFIFETPLISWGLPKRHFNPLGMLRHVVELIENGGYLLLINQGEAEYQEQQRLLSLLNQPTDNTISCDYDITSTLLGALPESFLPFQHTRYAILCHKVARL